MKLTNLIMAEQHPEPSVTNASASESEADNSDDSQGSKNPKKRKRNQKISYVMSDSCTEALLTAQQMRVVQSSKGN